MTWDVPQVATFLSLPAKTVRKLAAGRVIPAVKLGKSWRFDQTTLAEWLKNKTQENVRPTVSAAERAASDRICFNFKLPPQALAEPVSRSAIRNQRVRRATPAWANVGAISALYVEAQRLTRKTGRAHHVDHIVPIHGVTICGLHVENNLRVIEATANVRRPRRWSDENTCS